MPSYGRNGEGVLNYDELPYKLAKEYLPEITEQLKSVLQDKAVRLADDYYQNIRFCSEQFRIHDDEPLSEEECFLSMVGTPVRSARRHDQSMRLTLFVTNFLNNLRDELTKFDENLDDIEDAQQALGLSYTLWKISRSDFEDKIFGCYSLNLIAFEAIVTNIERLEELIELSFPTEPMSLPHQRVNRNSDAAVNEEMQGEGQEARERVVEVEDEEVEYVLPEEMPGEEFE